MCSFTPARRGCSGVRACPRAGAGRRDPPSAIFAARPAGLPEPRLRSLGEGRQPSRRPRGAAPSPSASDPANAWRPRVGGRPGWPPPLRPWKPTPARPAQRPASSTSCARRRTRTARLSKLTLEKYRGADPPARNLFVRRRGAPRWPRRLSFVWRHAARRRDQDPPPAEAWSRPGGAWIMAGIFHAAPSSPRGRSAELEAEPDGSGPAAQMAAEPPRLRPGRGFSRTTRPRAIFPSPRPPPAARAGGHQRPGPPARGPGAEIPADPEVRRAGRAPRGGGGPRRRSPPGRGHGQRQGLPDLCRQRPPRRARRRCAASRAGPRWSNSATGVAAAAPPAQHDHLGRTDIAGRSSRLRHLERERRCPRWALFFITRTYIQAPAPSPPGPGIRKAASGFARRKARRRLARLSGEHRGGQQRHGSRISPAHPGGIDRAVEAFAT